MPGKEMNSIKYEDQYEALRDKGMSKEKAARIANTENPDYDPTPYEERTKEVGIEGRSKMSKKELIKSLRED